MLILQNVNTTPEEGAAAARLETPKLLTGSPELELHHLAPSSRRTREHYFHTENCLKTDLFSRTKRTSHTDYCNAKRIYPDTYKNRLILNKKRICSYESCMNEGGRLLAKVLNKLCFLTLEGSISLTILIFANSL